MMNTTPREYVNLEKLTRYLYISAVSLVLLQKLWLAFWINDNRVRNSPSIEEDRASLSILVCQLSKALHSNDRWSVGPLGRVVQSMVDLDERDNDPREMLCNKP